MAKHHQNQIIFAWGNLAVLGSEVGSWNCSGRREAHLDEGVCGGGGGGCPTLPVLSKKAVCTAVFLKGISGDLQVAA